MKNFRINKHVLQKIIFSP